MTYFISLLSNNTYWHLELHVLHTHQHYHQLSHYILDEHLWQLFYISNFLVYFLLCCIVNYIWVMCTHVYCLFVVARLISQSFSEREMKETGQLYLLVTCGGKIS